LSQRRGKTLELVRNRPGSAACSVSMYDDMAAQIFDNLDIGDVRGSIRKTLLVRRDKKDMWSGANRHDQRRAARRIVFVHVERCRVA
jgi:hypothetical protein